MTLLLLLMGCPPVGPQDQTSQDSGIATDVQVDDPSTLPAGQSPCRDPVKAQVTWVVDGDTIWVKTEGREESVRLIGFNAPELGWDGGQDECWASQAHGQLESLVDNQMVWLTFDAECEDLYGRLLAYVHLGWSTSDFVNWLMLRQGHGLSFSIAPNDHFSGYFLEAEGMARQENLGWWSECQ